MLLFRDIRPYGNPQDGNNAFGRGETFAMGDATVPTWSHWNAGFSTNWGDGQGGTLLNNPGVQTRWRASKGTAPVGRFTRAIANNATDGWHQTMPVGLPTGTAFSLVASVAAFALAGQPASLNVAKRLTADSASFALAGQDATLRAGKSVTGGVGTFSVVGNVASFRVRRASAVGTFALAGQPATLQASKRLISSVGPFTLTGQPATLRVGKKLTSSVGAFTLTGQDARLGLSKSVTGAVGTFILTGQSSAFSVGRAVQAAAGTFVASGQDASLRLSQVMPSDVGAFALTGNDASLIVSRNVAGGVGEFALTGQAAGLRLSRPIQASVGSFALTGQAASLGRQIRLTSAAGSFTLTGQSATLLKTKLLVGSAGSFALTGGNVAFFYRRSQVGQNRVGLFPSPVNSVGAIDSNTVRSNDNITVSALNAHDSDASIHMQSGLLISRPTITAEGATYFCTDTRDTYTYVSNAWVQSGWAHWYGSFSDYTDQTIAAINTATKVTFDTVDMVSGFSLVSGSRMTAAYAGNYNFQWSGQFTNSDSAEQDVEIWVRINGVDVVGSAGRISVPKRHGTTDGHVLPGWNYFLPLAVGDYIELYWAAASTAIKIEHGNASAWAPSTASIIATMDRI